MTRLIARSWDRGSARKEFAAADPDKDATLTKEEYVALVQKLFKQADVDGDGKLEAKELRSKAGTGATSLDPLIDES